MASATAPAVQAPEPESVSSIGRIFGVFFSPKATFESIARRPTWLLPIVLLCLLSLGVVASFSQRGGWPSYFRKQVENSSRFQQMPPDQQQRVFEAQVKWGPRVAYVQVIVVPFVVAVVLAAIFLGMFNLVGGAQLGFKTSLAIVTHSFLPSVISGFLGILVILLKDPSTVDLQNLVASNVGAFLPGEAPRWQIALLGSLDLFSFWIMILLAMGYRAAAPKKLSLGTALVSIFGLWLVYVLAKTGIVAAIS
jgi:hypothetical protein